MLIYLILIVTIPFDEASENDNKYKYIIKNDNYNFWKKHKLHFDDKNSSDKLFMDFMDKALNNDPNKRMNLQQMKDHDFMK